jgi:ribulose 1,5-bisphosphate synthetase/thiazole synthase
MHGPRYHYCTVRYTYLVFLEGSINTMINSVIISATGHDGPMGAFSAKRLVSNGLLKELVWHIYLCLGVTG